MIITGSCKEFRLIPPTLSGIIPVYSTNVFGDGQIKRDFTLNARSDTYKKNISYLVGQEI